MEITPDMVGKEIYILTWNANIGKHYVSLVNPALGNKDQKEIFVFCGQTIGLLEGTEIKREIRK